MTAPAHPGPVWRTWTGAHPAPVHAVVALDTDADIAAAVAEATAAGRRVRAVGNGYSWVRAVPDDALVIRQTTTAASRVEIDTARQRAWVPAGMTILQAASTLFAEGWELPNLGGFAGQTIAGAISTATHGTGIGLPALSAAVTAVRLVDGRGDVVELSGGPELQAAQVALGQLGVIVGAQFALHPATWLCRTEQTVGRLDPAWLLADDGVRRDARWFPAAERFVVREWTRAARGAEGAVPAHVALAHAGATAPDPFEVAEHILPAEATARAVSAVEAALSRAGAGPTMPLALRVVAADDAFLSPFHDGAKLALSVAATGDGDPALFGLVHDVLVTYGARPHWAKTHRHTAAELHATYAHLPRFERVRRHFDPDGTFMHPEYQTILRAQGTR